MNPFLRKTSSLLILLAFVVSCSPSLRKQIERAPVFKDGFTGIAVYDLKDQKMLYKYNANKYFTPASNIKLLTFFAGIKYLGDSIPTFRYKISNDSLIFSATGDPSFLNKKFDNSKALFFLKNSDKNLYYVSSNWQDQAFGPGWAWDDYQYAFSAEKSAFPIYGNLVDFQFDSKTRNIRAEPEYFKDSITLFENGKNLSRKLNANSFNLSNDSSEDMDRSIPFKTSEKTSLALLSNKLNRKIVYLDNDTLRSGLDRELHTVPADSLYKEMLQESDNFIAEQILLMVSNTISDSLKSDIAISTIQKNDFNDLSDEIFWVDGSGLSRYNLATPEAMVKVLEKTETLIGQKKLMQLLPKAGRDGTLINFLSNENVSVYAKSGSMRNNYSLTGLLISKKGRTLLFSFMNSNYVLPPKELRKEMEQILLKIINKY